MSPVEPTSAPTHTGWYIEYGKGRCIDGHHSPPPHYIVDFYKELKECCAASYNIYPNAREDCRWALYFQRQEAGELDDGGQGGDGESPEPTYLPPPTDLPTPAPIASTMVEITVFGSLHLTNVNVPAGQNAQEWSKLKNVLMKTLSTVMAACSICHPGMVVELSTFAGRAFPARRTRRLESDELRDATAEPFDEEETTSIRRKNGNNSASESFMSKNQEEKRQVRRRVAGASDLLQFTMKIHAKCNLECQEASVNSYLAKLAFYEINDEFLQFIYDDVFSSTLHRIGSAWGLFRSGGTPDVISGSLTYRTAVESDVTWVPTFMPTVEILTSVPTSIPTDIPTGTVTAVPTATPTTDRPTLHPTDPCATMKWHYTGGGRCSNSANYPGLWDLNPVVGYNFLFDTLEACCVAKSPGGCIEVNACEGGEGYTGEAQQHCGPGGNPYHPTTPALRTCSNSMAYPASWKDDDRFLFDSAEDCCAAYYGDGMCLIKNICY